MNGSNKRTLDTGSNTTVIKRQAQKTPKQLHADMVYQQMEKIVKDEPYTTIVMKIESAPSVSVVKIVAEVNKLYNISILPDTVRRQLQKGITFATLGNGPKSLLPPLIEQALVGAMSSYINLACAEMDKQPQQKDMIAKLSSFLEDGPTLLRDYEILYKRLYKGFVSYVQVISGNSKIEEWRVIWTTFNNFNTWFNTLRNNIIAMGFDRVRLEIGAGEGELILLPGQLNRTLNLDELGLTLRKSFSIWW